VVRRARRDVRARGWLVRQATARRIRDRIKAPRRYVRRRLRASWRVRSVAASTSALAGFGCAAIAACRRRMKAMAAVLLAGDPNMARSVARVHGTHGATGSTVGQMSLSVQYFRTNCA
jgi:hypothetical protein